MKQRVVTAFFLAFATLFVVFLSSPYPVAGAGVIFAFLGGVELERLLNHRHLRYLTTGLTLALGWAASLGGPWGMAVAGLGVASILATLLRPGLWTVFWLSAPLSLLVVLHRPLGPIRGELFEFRPLLLLVLFPIWAGDIAAMLAGKAIGKHKLWPGVSPGKTWEGAIASLAASVLVAAWIGSFIGLNPQLAAILGVILGVIGQLGDLFESWLKRKASVKDSGNLLPGHGGILDRVDSVLFGILVLVLLGGLLR